MVDFDIQENVDHEVGEEDKVLGPTNHILDETLVDPIQRAEDRDYINQDGPRQGPEELRGQARSVESGGGGG